jgi:putative DNA primase/helicase
MTLEAVVEQTLAVVKSAPVEEIDSGGDFLNAERFLAEHGDRVRYAHELGRWFVWNGSWWQEDRLELAQELAKETIDGLRSWVGEARSESEFKRRARHYDASTRSGRRDGLLTIARTDRSVVVSVGQLDLPPHLLACRNGTVDLRTGELQPADPGHLITRGVELDYDPDARSETWDQFLETVFDHNAETIAYVRTLMGYAVTGEVGEHLLPDFYGSGANGKSTFITAITGVLPDHAAIAPEGLLVEQKHDQHPERLAMLRGRRLVVSLELEKRAVLAEGLIKSITGGDRISARYLYGQRFDFQPTHTVVLVTNHLPRVRGTDEAIWRRLRVVPFTVTIPVAERIPDFGKLLTELHGQAILAWLVRGAVDYYRHGLTEAEQVVQATFNYRQQEDVFAQFLTECTVGIRGRTKVKTLQAAWKAWAQDAGVPIGRNQDFIEQIEAHEVEIDTYQGAKFALQIGIVAGSEPAVRTREDSAGNSPHIHTHEEVMGRDLTRPHQTDETAGEHLFDSDAPLTDDYLETFSEYDDDEVSR